MVDGWTRITTILGFVAVITVLMAPAVQAAVSTNAQEEGYHQPLYTDKIVSAGTSPALMLNQSAYEFDNGEAILTTGSETKITSTSQPIVLSGNSASNTVTFDGTNIQGSDDVAILNSNGQGVYVSTGNDIGVKTNTPSASLEVKGDTYISNGNPLYFDTGTGITQFVPTITGSGNNYSVPTTSAVTSDVDKKIEDVNLSAGTAIRIDGSNNIDVKRGSGIGVSSDQLYVGAGNGLSQYTSGLAVDSPTCDGSNEKLKWDGSQFTCGTDKTGVDNYLPDDPATSNINLNNNNVNNVNSLNAQTTQLSAGTSLNEFSTDKNLTGNSDNAVPTEAAVKSYVDKTGGGSVNTTANFSGAAGRVAIWDGTQALSYSDQLQYVNDPNPHVIVSNEDTDTELDLSAEGSKAQIQSGDNLQVKTAGASGKINIDGDSVGVNADASGTTPLQVGGDILAEQGGNLRLSAPGSSKTVQYTNYGSCNCEYVCNPTPTGPDENTIEDRNCDWVCSPSAGTCDAGDTQVGTNGSNPCFDGSSADNALCEYTKTSTGGVAKLSASEDASNNMVVDVDSEGSTSTFTLQAERFEATNSKPLIKRKDDTASCGNTATVSCDSEYLKVLCESGSGGSNECSSTKSCGGRGGASTGGYAKIVCLHKYS